jgi:hypothetical protein
MFCLLWFVPHRAVILTKVLIHRKYRVHKKHLTVFEIQKPLRQLCAAFVLTIIMYSGVWSLAEMECRSVQHWIAAVELLTKTESDTAIHCNFRQQFQRCDAPCSNTQLLWVSKWCQEGSVKDIKPQGCPFSAPEPDNMKQVRDTMLQSPRKSAQQQALTCCLNKWSVGRILHKDLYYHPYKIQVAKELNE